MQSIIIIGTGMAGYTLAREFRKLNKDTPLVILTADDGSSYPKPNLSRALADAKSADELVLFSAEKMAASLPASIHTHCRVDAIDPGAHSISFGKQTLNYDKLVLATGAHSIRLKVSGNATNDILTVNDLDDYRRFRDRLVEAGSVAIIGAGLVGCEFASDLAACHHPVHIIAPAAHPLSHLLPADAADGLVEALANIGVQWHLGTSVTAVDHINGQYALSLSDNSTVVADIVLSAVGLSANTALAEAASIECRCGIITDNTCQTRATDIFAIGDCAEVAGQWLPFVMPFMHCARSLAKTLNGDVTAIRYPAMPVIVKTPAHPVVVVPPADENNGTWQVEAGDNGCRALFRNRQGQLTGFAVTGEYLGEKQRLLKDLSAAP